MSYWDKIKKNLRKGGLMAPENTGGVSRSWGDPDTVEEMWGNASKKVEANAAKTAAKKAAEKTTASKTSPATAAAQLTGLSQNLETSKIDTVADRYQGVYDDSQRALSAYNTKNFKDGMGGEGGSDELAAYNSPERGGLIRANRQAFRLLQKGSFADKANLKVEERQKNAAQAKSYLADTAYKGNLGKAAIANANTNASNLVIKRRESQIAEDYLNGGKKKKKTTEIDLNDIHALFN